jgi:hypothetical protein
MRIIRPNRSALTVIHDIARCDTLITSSLHGIIVADSLGIPVQPEPFPNLPNEGGDFKHRDYSSALGIRNEFGKMRQAPRDRVEEAQRSLREVLRVLA